ncbi:hypothetical protein [Stenotrophomonas sp. PS02298]|uniref:hypothetical protein n=1 Tax=Stenotrophomonas sp. PS02298 TaxID=2991424 RepID=UPI00249A0E60|nr:hypothetical protein [Stenotrophomonas sp. PS02298]
MTNGISLTLLPTTNTGQRICRGLLLAGILLLGACATQPGPLGTLSNITVTESGVDNERDALLCHGFKPDPRQVRAFFRQAVLITPRQQHDFFLHGPCYVRGTLTTAYETWHWELRNGGTARVTSAAGDDAFLLADPREETSLGDE